MKKLYVSLMAMVIASVSFSQSYSDDFESYSVGDYIGVESSDWSTWSGTTGGTEDAQITDDQANSGINSIYFEAVGSSGPQDVVLDFGGLHTEDIFNFEAYFYIPDGNSAYFNFQGDETIGETWAIDVYMNNDGSLIVSNQGVTKVLSEFPSDDWFKVEFAINLTLNNWQFLLDDVALGSWTNSVNQLSMADFYPATSDDLWYMDDVSYSVEEYVLPNLNAMVTDLGIGAIGVVGQEKYPAVTVRNVGVTEIASFDLDVTYNGELIEISESGLTLASLESIEVDLTDFITLVEGSNDLVATVSNVNGGDDDVPDDDSNTKNIDPAVAAAGKVVIGEEATGTWCQWCPRGAVFMDFMADNYDGYFMGIAVHNADPMTNVAYDTWIGPNISGYPSALVDRGSDIDPSALEIDFVDRVGETPSATITTGAQWEGDDLMVSLTYDVSDDIPSSWKVACVITEDGVTGTSSGYAQSNAYAGGGAGPMGGYEDLPNPVPASMMVYNHVARTISPSPEGLSDAFPTGASSGESHTFNFTFPIDSEWDSDNMHIIGMLIEANGDINNGGGSTIDEAIENGYVEGVEVVGIEELSHIVSNFEVYPNPAANEVKINIELQSEENVSIQLLDLTGKAVRTIDFGRLNGTYILPIDLNEVHAGMYIVNLWVGNNSITQKLIVE